jgi:membrane protease YdiL (CAAX protease family)
VVIDAVRSVQAQADAESAAALATDRRGADRATVVILLVGAVSLTLGQFLSRNGMWIVNALHDVGLAGWSRDVDRAFTTSSHAQFWTLVEWAALQVAGYVLLPMCAIRWLLHQRVSDYGLRVRGIGRFASPYLLLFLAAFPFLFVASYATTFQSRYPFYDLAPHEALWPYLWLWWGCYALQFVALEFFFRGYLVHGLVPRFGFMAVFVMALPYNMLHYGKPMPEALAAIVGGVVLGVLAIRTRSIWWGAALHISIAGTIDVLSLWHKGILF